MTVSESIERTSPLSWKNLIRMLIGAVIGAAFGYGAIAIAEHLHVAVKEMSWADGLAAWLGVTFFGIGVTMIVVSFNRRELARNLEGGVAKVPASAEEVLAARLQGATAALAGVMLLLPVLTSGMVARSRLGAEIVFGTILLLFVLQTVANWQVWRTSDEYMKQVVLKSHALTTMVGTAGLFLWASAERLHLVRAATGWETIVLLLTVYLFAGASIQLQALKWK